MDQREKDLLDEVTLSRMILFMRQGIGLEAALKLRTEQYDTAREEVDQLRVELSATEDRLTDAENRLAAFLGEAEAQRTIDVTDKEDSDAASGVG